MHAWSRNPGCVKSFIPVSYLVFEVHEFKLNKKKNSENGFFLNLNFNAQCYYSNISATHIFGPYELSYAVKSFITVS